MLDFLKRLFGASNQKAFGYSPVIGRSRTVRSIPIGELKAELLTDLESTGAVEYSHILAVYDAEGNPVLFVASEVNSSVEQFGGGSHFIGVFDGTGHATLDDSDDWADLESFAAEAVKVVKQHFGID